MTKQDILEQLKEFLEENGSYQIDDLGSKYSKFKLNGVTFEQEENIGGEGQGDHAHIVVEVKTDSDTFFLMIDGFYSSYEGTEWDLDSLTVVEPYMKEVRDWKKINVIGECR